jgi:hypothetical protein
MKEESIKRIYSLINKELDGIILRDEYNKGDRKVINLSYARDYIKWILVDFNKEAKLKEKNGNY